MLLFRAVLEAEVGLIGIYRLAWAVSLHPSAETYAATGASGNVTIHSAGPSNFGERIAKLESGRTRMGMSIAHVRLPSTRLYVGN